MRSFANCYLQVGFTAPLVEDISAASMPWPAGFADLEFSRIVQSACTCFLFVCQTPCKPGTVPPASHEVYTPKGGSTLENYTNLGETLRPFAIAKDSISSSSPCKPLGHDSVEVVAGKS